MKYLLPLVLLLSGCASFDGSFKKEHELLFKAEKAEKKMESGLAIQASGAALTAEGRLVYQEGKKEREEALSELAELLE